MALQVWIPGTDGTLKNQGLYPLPNPSYNNIASTNDGKLGKDIKNFAIYHLNSDFIVSSWSICTWVKFSSTWSEWNNIIFAKNTSDSEDSQIYLSIVNNTTLNIGRGASGGFTYQLSNEFQPGVWYHIAATCDGTNVTLYLNGSKVAGGSSIGNYKSALNLCIGCRSTNEAGTGPTGWGPEQNDIRVYDHCLSPKEVKEIAKGLVLHYPLNDAYVEGTNNLFAYPTPGSNCANSYGWDKILHENAISVSGWSSGYNRGVEDPSTVYHAHWIMMDGLPTMRFPYITNSLGQTPEWLGISGWFRLQPSNFISGIKYTVSFDAKADENNSAISCGLYYKRNSSENWNFYDGNRTTTLTTDWKRYSVTYTSQGAYEISSFYFYGVCSGSKGNRYIRNVQLEIKDHATPYTPNTRTATTVYDCSGYQNNGTVEEFKAAGNNLVTGLTAGGQTTVSGETVTTSGVNADTYFTINLSESIVVGQTYTLSCIGKNIPTDGYFGFPLGWQGNTSLIFNIKNGYNEITFTANDGSWGTNRLFMDDMGRDTAYMNQCEFTSFKLYKHSTVNSGLNAVFDSPRYKIGAKFNGQHDIQLSSPLGSGAKEELTVSFWHKPNSQGNYRTIFSNSNPHSGFWIGCNCEGRGLWYYGGSGFYVQSQNLLSNDVWHHCVLTYKDQTYQWYLDGIPVTTSTSGTFKAPTFSDIISIGGNTNGDMKGSSGDYRQWGSLSDFRIYSTALSADDIKELYNTSCIINS